jgi:hypothetical protein
MEAALERIDSLVTVSVFASLAGLSLATTAFVGGMQAGVADVGRALQLVTAMKSLIRAFRLFVVGLAAAVGFDGIVSSDVVLAADFADVFTTGGPLVVGVALLYQASREIAP